MVGFRPFDHPGDRVMSARFPNVKEGYSMYIGIGTLVAVLVIVLIIYFIRRA